MVLNRRAPLRVGASLLAAALVAGVGGCAGAPHTPLPNPEERAALAWPPPPAAARITWETAFTVPRDLRLRTGFWRRARRLVFGGADDALNRPQGITVVGDVVYLTDAGRPRVLVYDRGRRRFTALAANAQRPWRAPIGVAATRDGVLFVADALGILYRVAPPWRSAVALDWPGLERPVAVAVDEARDRLYVLDAPRHRVLHGTLDGRYQGEFGQRGAAPGEFNFPTHLTVMPDGNLLVTDAMNFRIQRLTPDGRPLHSFGQPGDGTGDLAKPKGVAVDADGAVYVVDGLFGVVQLFDAQGQLLMWFGESGRRAGQFWLPTGIAIDDDGRIYVADSYNRRVQVFTRLPNPAS